LHNRLVIYNAPRELVFATWKDPEKLNHWYAPDGCTIEFKSKLVFSMILSNENGDEVRSFEAGKPEDWPEEILTTVTFTAVANQTKLSIHQTVAEAEAKQTGAYQSWIKMLNKLAQLIAG
jgi:uncharacterized protein YndB with AHSA1/START domain